MDFLPARRIYPLCFGLSIAAVLSAPMAGHSQERISWPNRFGPTSNGHVADADATGVPMSWDEQTEQNVAWKIKLGGLGHSTPVIGAGRIWLTTATEEGHQQFIECYDEKSGEQIHRILLFENEDPEPLGNPINTYASPSCVLTADALYVHFGTYGTARLDPASGDVVWQRRDINVRHFRGPGSSPVLFENLLILTFDGIDRQFLTALDVENGDTVWLTERTTDYGDLDENGLPHREGDMRKAYSTPGIVRVDGQAQVVSVGSRAAFGYDARSGDELWMLRHDDYNAASAPIFYRDLAIVNTGSRNANLTAVKLAEDTRGDITTTHVAWDVPRGNSRMSAPLLADGRIYAVSDRGVVRCVSADDGSEIWAGRIEGNFISSPIAVNGHVLFCNEEGQTYVLRGGDEFEVVHENKLAEGMRASPAAANGALFLRTFQHLYKIAR